MPKSEISEAAALEHIYANYLKCIAEPYIWNGILYPGYLFKSSVLDSLCNFRARPDDIYVASFPRSGTTWVTELVSLINSNVDVEHVKTLDISIRVPLLELSMAQSLEDGCRNPYGRLLQTHLPFQHLPLSITNSGCKIIYVMRNPKDVAVSSYYHHKMAKHLGYYDGTFDDYLQLFINGKVVIGSWFEHIKSYWQQNGKANVLFVKYENLIKDLKGEIKILSSHIGTNLTDDQIGLVSQHCSFEDMKLNVKVNRTKYVIFDQTKGAFIRKGVVGDWKNHFNEAANLSFDNVYQKWMNELRGLNFDFQ